MSRTAVVTGGASGIGQATANRLAADGIDVVTLDRNGGDLVIDVADPYAVAAAATQIGAVDIVINSAGIIGPNAPLWEITDHDWATTFAVNVTGTFNVCRAFIPGMMDRRWGRIVNLASMAGKDGNPRLSAYSASKAAVIGLTKSLGKELALTGILVNAVAPALIATPMNAATTHEVLEYLTNLIPMHRLGTADEAAELIAWLASERCSFSTGAVYDLSGGRATY